MDNINVRAELEMNEDTRLEDWEKKSETEKRMELVKCYSLESLKTFPELGKLRKKRILPSWMEPCSDILDTRNVTLEPSHKPKLSLTKTPNYEQQTEPPLPQVISLANPAPPNNTHPNQTQARKETNKHNTKDKMDRPGQQNLARSSPQHLPEPTPTTHSLTHEEHLDPEVELGDDETSEQSPDITTIQSSTKPNDCPRYKSVPIENSILQLLTPTNPTLGQPQHPSPQAGLDLGHTMTSTVWPTPAPTKETGVRSCPNPPTVEPTPPTPATADPVHRETSEQPSQEYTTTAIQSSTIQDDCPRYGSVPVKKYTQQLLSYFYPTPGLLQHHTVEKVLPYSATKTGPLQPNQLVLPSPSGPHPHPQQELNLEPTISTPTQQQPYQHQGQWTKPALPTPSGPQCYTH